MSLFDRLSTWWNREHCFVKNPWFWLLTGGVVAAVVLTGGFLLPLLAAIPVFAVSAEIGELNFKTWGSRFWRLFSSKKVAVLDSNDALAEENVNGTSTAATINPTPEISVISSSSSESVVLIDKTEGGAQEFNETDSDSSVDLSDTAKTKSIKGSEIPIILADNIDTIEKGATVKTTKKQAGRNVETHLTEQEKHYQYYLEALRILAWFTQSSFLRFPDIKVSRDARNDFAEIPPEQKQLIKHENSLEEKSQFPDLDLAGIFKSDAELKAQWDFVKKSFRHLLTKFAPDKGQLTPQQLVLPTIGIIIPKNKIRKIYDDVYHVINAVFNWMKTKDETIDNHIDDEADEEDIIQTLEEMTETSKKATKEHEISIAESQKSKAVFAAQIKRDEAQTAEIMKESQQSIIETQKFWKRIIEHAVNTNDFSRLDSLLEPGDDGIKTEDIIDLANHKDKAIRLSKAARKSLIANKYLKEEDIIKSKGVLTSIGKYASSSLLFASTDTTKAASEEVVTSFNSEAEKKSQGKVSAAVIIQQQQSEQIPVKAF